MRICLKNLSVYVVVSAIFALTAFSEEPVKVYILDPKISKSETKEVFSDSKYQIIDASKNAGSNCDPLFEKSGLSSFTKNYDPYEKKMLSLRAQSLSLEKLQKKYPKLPAEGLTKLMELSHAK